MTAGAPWLRGRGLTKQYGGTLAMAGVDFELRAGEVRGLVGANGAGKSTLVKVLAGEVSPDGGETTIDGAAVRFRKPGDAREAGIVDVPQELFVAPNLSIAENVMLGHLPTRHGRVDRAATWAAAERALGLLRLDLSPDLPVGSLQPIEQRLIVVARALAREARLVIFDEPTATASPTEASRVRDAVRLLSDRGVSVLYVSHRLDEIVGLCSLVTVMRDGRVLAELPVEPGTREQLVEMMSATPQLDAGSGAPARRSRPAAVKPVLEVSGLAGGSVRDVSLTVHEGEIVGVAGLAGSGAGHLPLIVCGAMPAVKGTVEVAGGEVPTGNVGAAVAAGIGFVSGDRREGALSNHTVAHNVSLPTVGRHTRLGIISSRREGRAVAEAIVPVHLYAGPGAVLGELSGGNQQKALIARWIGTGVRLLVLDDPTAGVDVGARAEIHAHFASVAEAGLGMLVVSTDLEELAEICDRVIILEHGAVKAELRDGHISEQRLLDVLSAKLPEHAA